MFRSPRASGGALAGCGLLLLVLLAFGALGTRGLWEPDEGRYVLCANEMLRSGNWIVPTLHGLPHLTKPPMTYWAIAVGLSLTGASEWGARLYLALSFLGTALVLGAWGRRLWGAAEGRWTGLIFATSLLPFIAASVATTDMLLTFFETAAMYALWRGWRAGGRLWTVAGWALFGLAFLTKGPPALLPLSAWFVVSFATGRDRGWRERLRWLDPFGVLVFVAVALPWFLLLVGADRGVASYFLGEETLSRVMSTAHHRNSRWYKAFVVYLPALTLGLLPWSAGWPLLWRRRERCPRSDGVLLAAWFAVPLAIFALSRSRLVFYVVPLFAPLALLSCGLLLPLLRRRGAAWAIALALLPWSAGLVSLRLLPERYWPERNSRVVAQALRQAARETPREIVEIGRRLHGLTFYLDSDVELTSLLPVDEPSYWPPRRLVDELKEALESPGVQLLVYPSGQAPALDRRLRALDLECPIVGGVGELLFSKCRPAAIRPAKLAVATLRSGTLPAMFRVADRLRRAAEENELLGVVVLTALRPVEAPLISPVSPLWRLREQGIPVDEYSLDSASPGQLELARGRLRLDRGCPLEPQPESAAAGVPLLLACDDGSRTLVGLPAAQGATRRRWVDLGGSVLLYDPSARRAKLNGGGELTFVATAAEAPSQSR